MVHRLRHNANARVSKVACLARTRARRAVGRWARRKAHIAGAATAYQLLRKKKKKKKKKKKSACIDAAYGDIAIVFLSHRGAAETVDAHCVAARASLSARLPGAAPAHQTPFAGTRCGRRRFCFAVPRARSSQASTTPHAHASTLSRTHGCAYLYQNLRITAVPLATSWRRLSVARHYSERWRRRQEVVLCAGVPGAYASVADGQHSGDGGRVTRVTFYGDACALRG